MVRLACILRSQNDITELFIKRGFRRIGGRLQRQHRADWIHEASLEATAEWRIYRVSRIGRNRGRNREYSKILVCWNKSPSGFGFAWVEKCETLRMYDVCPVI